MMLIVGFRWKYVKYELDLTKCDIMAMLTVMKS